MQIMNSVDFLDLVDIIVVRDRPTPIDPCPVAIHIEPLDKSKNVVFDSKALVSFNETISERIRNLNLSWKNPNTVSYIQEVVGRIVSEMYRNGLVALENASDSPIDHYADLRTTPTRKI